MTLWTSLVAFLIMLLISTAIILPLSITMCVLFPLSATYVQVGLIPTLIYTTKTLLEWNSREIY